MTQVWWKKLPRWSTEATSASRRVRARLEGVDVGARDGVSRPVM